MSPHGVILPIRAARCTYLVRGYPGVTPVVPESPTGPGTPAWKRTGGLLGWRRLAYNLLTSGAPLPPDESDMNSILSKLSLPAMALLACFASCHGPSNLDNGPDTGETRNAEAALALPLEASVDVLELAQHHELTTPHAVEVIGIHNVFQLSENIVSGGEPESAEALAALASMGIKTILSVDGKVPDAATAAELGMRYVHIPIQYSGIDELELVQIAKTFRELEGPFFVHCFHGKHRGPAAAAVGRLTLDGIPREHAVAEMHQWCGTSLTYDGLFKTIGQGAMPGWKASGELAFDFPASHAFDGFRGTMVPMARHWDEIKFARKRKWALNPNKPDIVPAQEALQLSQIFEQCLEQTDLPADTEQVRGWLEDGKQGTGDLARLLTGQKELEAQGVDWKPQAEDAYRLVAKSCKQCHLEYRN